MTPQHILRVLSQHPDNNITEFHRALNSVGGVFTGGGATGGVTLNSKEPYYTWRNPEKNEYISFNHLLAIREYLTAVPWGDMKIGGTVYRLRDDIDVDAVIEKITPKRPQPKPIVIHKPKAGQRYIGKRGIEYTIISASERSIVYSFNGKTHQSLEPTKFMYGMELIADAA